MRSLLKITVAAAALVGAAMLGAPPAQAQGFAIGVGPGGGINFSTTSGGYCDEYGCPDQFWDYPVYYCPVYYRGDWYRGPVYYRDEDGDVRFWVHGGWHHDQWDDPRPDWACTDRFGPALGFDFYDGHGFRMRDIWRTWFHLHGHHGHHGPGPGPAALPWHAPGPGWWHAPHPGPLPPPPPGPPPHPGPGFHVPVGGLHPLPPGVINPPPAGPVYKVPPGGFHKLPPGVINPPKPKPLKPHFPIKLPPNPGP